MFHAVLRRFTRSRVGWMAWDIQSAMRHGCTFDGLSSDDRICHLYSARINAVLGDITQQPDCDAIVNAANTRLRKGGGVCGAIYHAAGPEMETFTSELASIQVSEAIITPGFRLPNTWVIHVAGPRYGVDCDPENLLSRAMRNLLELADVTKVVRIAVPAISTGIYGYPMDQASSILIGTAKTMIATLRNVREIRFVLTSSAALRHFQ